MPIQLSVIIVSYNSFNILKRCLKSLYEFTSGISFEVIIVDNASSEGDISKIIVDFSNIRVIKNEYNIGFAAANNKGLNIAEGKYILFLNNDVIFKENTLQKILLFLESSNDSRMLIGCRLLNDDGSIQISIDRFDSIWNTLTTSFFLYTFFPKSKVFNRYYENFSELKDPKSVHIIKGAFILSNKKFIDDLGGFDERFFFYSEEKDLCKRAINFGGKVIFYPNTEVIHLGGATAGEESWFKYKHILISKIQYFSKHYSFLKSTIIISIFVFGIVIRIPTYIFIGIFNKSFLNKSFLCLKQIIYLPKAIMLRNGK
ncbi:MAG: glycosyltransferase family 2 protein [Melioribacteraceae bacterium]|nr:glycosyltransferase family 2 protein [Melioribacteraceae bacterium]